MACITTIWLMIRTGSHFCCFCVLSVSVDGDGGRESARATMSADGAGGGLSSSRQEKTSQAHRV
jgi:hypothetical protein